MARTLKEIQAKLLEQEAKKDRSKNNTYTGDNVNYPFWNNPDGTTSTVRFLPDGNAANDFFWTERLLIKLPFAGIKGQRDTKRVEVQVPCTDMWEPRSCSVNAAISSWWNDESLVDMARIYYRKKSYLFQGFVLTNPNPDDVAPENPIRRFNINVSIFDIIKGILLRQDLEHSPTDYEHGRDFDIIKAKGKGNFPNYMSSAWSMRERALNTDELEAIAKYDLWDLSSFLPARPDEAHKNAIRELFEASVDGELYDSDRWGQFYRPPGFKNESSDVATGATARPAAYAPKVAASVVEDEIDTTPPFEVVAKAAPAAPAAEASSGKKTPEEILAAIRSRQQTAR